MKFLLATNRHEPELRRLAQEQAMPGWIRIAYTHEPDWFRSQAVLGHTVQTVVGETATRNVAGCGVRAIRRVFVNGRETEMGYLCGLRADPASRNQGHLARGYRCLRQLHDADRLCPAYMTTIVEGNSTAIALLTSGRAGLPAYLDQGRIITSAIPLGQRRVPPSPVGLTSRTGAEIPFDDILGFLAREGRKQQFFPALKKADFTTQLLAGLKPDNFRVVLDGNGIVGVTAIWDQTDFRQYLVAGYTPALRWSRPLLNLGLHLAGRRPLPKPGQCLSSFHAAFTCARGGDPAILTSLLGSLCASHRDSPHHHFVIGLHERDPLRAALRDFPSREYRSRLYLACWEDGRPFCEALDSRLIPHIETAML